MLAARARRVPAALVASLLTATGLVTVAVPASAAPTSQTFGYSASTQTFTVPAGVTSVDVLLRGGHGGRGGNDATASQTGSYAGLVTGTLAVTPGQVLTIGVGKGGGLGGSGGFAAAGVGGTNPLGSVYAGGNGGRSGNQGSSGSGGGGGAATVLRVGSTDIVAGGSGGGGGSGQYAPLAGRTPYASHSPRTDSTSSNGQPGINVNDVCTAPGSVNCDGGAPGGGGGGAQGGARGSIEFGVGVYTEWMGYGGYPGSSSTTGLTAATSSYVYSATNGVDGTVVLSWEAGPPGAPTGVTGSVGNASVPLTWTAPASSGLTAVSDYVVQHAPASSPSSWTTVQDGVSASTSTTVTGLLNGTAYVFRVAAVNSEGTGAWSTTSGAVTPSDVPGAPVITSVTPQDGAVSLAFSPAPSDAPVLGYEYRVGSGDWYPAGTTSPVVVGGLLNGTSYDFRLRASNVVGTGAASAAETGTPQAAPGAPTITSVTTSRGGASLAVTPGFTGGLEVLRYEHRLGSGPAVDSGTATGPVVLTGLGDGTTSLVQVRAVTSAGAGSWSATASVTTPSAPAAPTLASVARGDRSLAVVLSPGASGGLPTTGYEYRLDSGDWTPVGLQSSFSVSGLVNGTTYAVTVRAVNEVGPGAASSAVDGTPATVPAAPAVAYDLAASDGALSVSFTPGDDGGSPLTGYEYSTDSGATWRARGGADLSSPWVVSTLSSDGTTPLENGVQYRVQLRAVNAVGTGAASAFASGIPAGPPDAPVGLVLTPGAGSLTASFTPAGNGGSTITAYEYRLGAGPAVGTGTLSPGFAVTGLQDGEPVEVSVRAVNAQGSSEWSAPAIATPRSRPGVPVISATSRGDQTLSVTAAVASDGGSPVTGWQTSTDGGATWGPLVASTTMPLVVTTTSDGAGPVANGTAYPVAVRAVNDAGAGPASGTVLVSPSGAPAAPTVSVTPGAASLSVAYAVADDGGSPVTGLEYRLGPTGPWTSPGTLTSPFTVPELENGTTYAVQVRALNAIGAGDPSAPVDGTPRTTPGAPDGVTASGDGGTALVSWSGPADDGGAPVSSSTARAHTAASGGTVAGSCSTASTSCTITGLTNGTTYYVAVTATNAAGAGAASSPRVPVTPLARPSAPVIGSISGGNAFLSVPFTAGAAGSAAITGYQYSLDGGAWTTASSATSPITISGLVNGTTYSVRLRAVSSVGAGDPSTAASGRPFTVPDTPSAATLFADARSGAIVVSWPAVPDNGSPVTEYIAVAWSAATLGFQVRTCTTAALTCTLTSLSNGITYYVSLQATNAAGASLRSDRVAATPSLLPGAVRSLAATRGDGQVALTWLAGGQGASAITDYVVESSTDGTTWTTVADGVSTTTAAVVTGLTNGVLHTFRVSAVNGSGTGPATSTTATPATVPGAPSSVTAVRGDGSATVSWTAPASGGSPVTGYVVTPSSGSPVTVGDVTTTTVTGLTNGTPYTFTVAAVNALGTGAPSAASAAVVPLGAPSAPLLLTAVRGDRQVSLSWSAPASDGGSAVLSYVVTPSVGDPLVVAGRSLTVGSLVNGTPYSFTVAAVNAVGTGASAAAGPVVPATLPGAPTGLSATRGDGQVALSWSPPTSDGGSAVTGYLVTPSTGSPVTVGGTSTTLSGLTNGVALSFTVSAVNGVGAGAPAVAGPVVPAGTAGAPTGLAAVPGPGSVTLSWSPPGSTGGLPVTAYVVTAGLGDPVTVHGLTTTVTGLTSGTAYVFTVAAVTDAGTGAAAQVGPVTVATVPGTPTGLTATRGNGQVVLSWSAPPGDAGSPVTGYVVTREGGSPVSVSGTTTTVTGLVNGTEYAFAVAAVNGVGAGAAATVSAVPARVPGSPQALVVTGVPGGLELEWQAPDDGGAVVTGYLLTVDDAAAVALGPVLAHDVTGLSPGAHDVALVAVNAVGEGAAATGSGVVPAPPAPPAPVPPVPVPPTPGPTAPDPAPGALASDSGTSTGDGPVDLEAGALRGSARGRGGITVSQLPAPTGTAGPGAAPDGHYLVAADEDHDWDELELRLSDEDVTSLWWHDGDQWRKVAADRDPATGELVVLLTRSTAPSLDDLGSVELAAGTTPSVRLAGSERTATAAAVSRHDYPARGSARSVVLARSDVFADALAGAPLAAQEGGPVLLTGPDLLPRATVAELLRVLPRGGTVHVLGGPSAVSPAVTDVLRRLGYAVSRVAGPDRFATARAVADRLDDPSSVLLVDGLGFADALAAGPAAVVSGGAVLLTRGVTADAGTASLVRSLGVPVYAVGGRAAAADRSAVAVVGADRVRTAVLVAERWFPDPSAVGLAVADRFPDALVAGPSLGSSDAPLLLTGPGDVLPLPVAEYLHRHRTGITSVVAFGGGAAVSSELLSAAVRAVP